MITHEAEESIFAKAVPNRAQELNVPVIELPTNALESMLWVTRLDSNALQCEFPISLLFPPYPVRFYLALVEVLW